MSKCIDCRFRHEVEEDGLVLGPECRRFPPPWREVQDDGWCGEFKIVAAFPQNESGIIFASGSQLRNAAEEIKLIMNSFNIPVRTFAEIFKVSAQTIYNWKGGIVRTIRDESLVFGVVDAIRILTENGVEPCGSHVRSRVLGGKSFIDKLISGDDPVKAANELVEVLRNDANRRKLALQKRPDATVHGAKV